MQRVPTPEEARFVNVSLAQGYSLESVAVHLEIKGWDRAQAAAYLEASRRRVAAQRASGNGQTNHSKRSFQFTLGITLVTLGVALAIGVLVLLDDYSAGTFTIPGTFIAAGAMRLMVA